MFRDRRFLTGLGTGMIAGAIMLQLMIAAPGSGGFASDDGAGPPEPMTEEQLLEAAGRLGYRLYGADDARMVEGETGPSGETDAEGETGQTGRKGAEADASAAQPGTDPAVQPGSDLAAETDAPYRVEIPEGLTSDEIGELLLAAGLLDDLEAYRNEMARRGLTVKIRNGIYTFDNKPELAALIDRITIQ